ncbi:PTS glucose transporter subunit IIA [Globicatella sulfidifaciens]|uniref:PTS sugar transporter subunit IIA n=1 Tax=Globicatella sulfidifaciens TaxID=136093 RepID=UPI00289010CD|nr:PTS glucose transporter subunit IIA [Globicatella sulfidifaciens]MDT2768016.1 PTS glucose transporter subunit IIA [Globicatella sulfidifaciens]
MPVIKIKTLCCRIDIAKVNDPVFGGKIMGEGFAVQPTNGNVVSPVDAEVVMIMDSKHAVGLKTADGLELLIHMGIETVQLNGGGFELFVQEGDQLKAGDAAAQMDLDYILNEGKQTDVIVALTNTPDMVNRTIIEDEKSVEAGSSIGQVDIKA